jgi:hypothetical protein
MQERRKAYVPISSYASEITAAEIFSLPLTISSKHNYPMKCRVYI